MKRGFTLVELLTVITIIAILAAIIFPVAGTVRERARRASCTANLKEIYTALELYKLDEGAYPPLLFGWAGFHEGILRHGCEGFGQNGEVLPMDSAPSFLGPYLKTFEVFHCPNNPKDDRRLAIWAYYPLGHALYGPNGMVRLNPADENSPHVCFYIYDSYDIGWNPIMEYYELRYTLFWTGRNAYDIDQEANTGYFDDPIGGKPNDSPRQLGYRNPDKATTVVTWCSYHRRHRFGETAPERGADDLVLFLSGTVKPMDPRWIYDSANNSPYKRRP